MGGAGSGMPGSGVDMALLTFGYNEGPGNMASGVPGKPRIKPGLGREHRSPPVFPEGPQAAVVGGHPEKPLPT